MTLSKKLGTLGFVRHESCIAVLVAFAAFGQTQPEIFRFEPANKDCCTGEWDNGRYFAILTHNYLYISLYLEDDKATGKFGAFIHVENRGHAPIDVNPEMFTMVGKELKTSTSIPLEKMMRRPSKLGTALAAAAAGADGYNQAGQQQRTGSATIKNPDGTTSQVDIYQHGPTPAQQRQAQQNAANARQAAAEQADWNAWLIKAALQRNTVQVGKSVSGFVYFPREKKKHQQVVIRLPIEGVVYEFAMTPQ